MFSITKKSVNSRARSGVLKTDHGDIHTPVFMPVGTQATVKTLDSMDLEMLGPEIILANTYHLHLRPGEDLIDSFGGLHKFMSWNKPMLTDSGGFQVFSLGAGNTEKTGQEKLVSIDDDGVTFRSHIDGSEHRFTPEEAIRIQHKLGADIIMAFDECTPDDADIAYTKKAMARTHAWAERCIAEHKKNNHHHGYKQFLFGIVQGAGHKELRIESAKAISAMDFDGIAIGGESIGFNMDKTKEILDWVVPELPKDKARYTMGLGYSPKDLFDAVAGGADMFDCVAPTRVARNGTLYVHPSEDTKMKVTITNAQFRDDKQPISNWCNCHTCKHYSRAYLHHLFKAGETAGLRLATIHNVRFMLKVMEEIRHAIKEDRFEELQKEWV